MIRPTNSRAWFLKRNRNGYTRIEAIVTWFCISVALALAVTGMIVIPIHTFYIQYTEKKVCEKQHGMPCVQQTVYVPKQEAEPQQ